MNAVSDSLVLLGVTGDLSRRKLLPALYQLAIAGRLPRQVIGVAPPGVEDAWFRDLGRQAIRSAFVHADSALVEDVMRRIVLVVGDLTRSHIFEALADHVADADRPTYFLAVPPDLFDVVVNGMVAADLHRRAQVMIEKPFGRDSTSARLINETLGEIFDPRSILRVDHYLGKESVENLLIFRLSNSFLQPIWCREHIAQVQITHCEVRGVEERGHLYDSVGAVRDVVQSHLLLLMALLVMRPPADADGESMHEEVLRVLRATRSVSPGRLVRGQYTGYTATPGVAPDSVVETYAAMRLEVDLPEWAGVPFYMRSGKGLANTAIEAVVEFQPVRRPLWCGGPADPEPNRVRFRVGRDPGISMTANMRGAGPGPVHRTVDMCADLDAAGASWKDYTHLLMDALNGETGRFVPAEAVAEAWRIVAPALDLDDRPEPYPLGSWGPPTATAIVDDGCWYTPL